MEIVFISGILIVIFVPFLLKKSRGNKGRRSTDGQSIDRNANVVPFDRDTARTPTERIVLTGPAHVIDGDSLVIQKTQVRLFGIDAPELDHPHGQKAKWAMVSMCKGQKVRAIVTEQDEYGRTVAHCYLPDGRDLSAELVRLGLALDWPRFSGGKYRGLEQPGVRKKLWLADARQKGRMHVWKKYEEWKSQNGRR